MIYELRVYYSETEKLPALLDRFRNHTCKLFEKHGIKNVGYWTNAMGGGSNELRYLLAYEDMNQREAAWAAFAADPEWQKARAESHKDGPLVHHFENRFLRPTDFSPLQ